MNIKRIAEKILDEYLKVAGAVLLTGPKFCGKTYLANLKANSRYDFQRQDSLLLKNSNSYDSRFLLEGQKPKLLDEWQELPIVWDLVRNYVDHGENGKHIGLFILIGSTKPIDRSEIKHSGAGRILKMSMATLTFSEILNLDSDKSITFFELIDNKFKQLQNPLTIDEVNKLLLKGGWPFLYANDIDDYKKLVDGYIDSVIDFSDYNNQYKFNIDQQVLRNVLKSIARLTSSQIKKTTILEDVNKQLDRETLDKYMNILYDLDILFDVPVWKNSNIRSKYKIRTVPKTYMCDTSLVCRLLDINTINELMEDFNTTGIIFENQVMKDLNVFAQSLNGKLYFYRDEKGHEIDAIIELDDSRWIAIEIKLSLLEAIEAVKTLNKNIDILKMTGKHSKPCLKMIITNTEHTVLGEDNTYIIPHTLLKG